MGRAGLAAVVQALTDLKRPPIVASALSPVNSDKVDAVVIALMKANSQTNLRNTLAIHHWPPGAARCRDLVG